MKEIKLTQGKVALVDDEDFDYLNQWKWHAHKHGNTFYARRNFWIGKKTITHFMHWYVIGRLPGLIVDHIDGNGLNNQKYNLRHVTTRQNGQNLHIKKSSRFPGVYWHSTSKKWASMIKIGDTKKFLGNFDSELAAFNAYYLKLKEIGEVPHFFLKGEIKNAFI